jgi:hypothetical protein
MLGKTEGAINNGQSIETGNIGYTRHMIQRIYIYNVNDIYRVMVQEERQSYQSLLID